METFGCKNPFQNPDIIKKIEEHNIKTYGVKSHNQSNIVKQNKIKSVREKYGVDSVMYVDKFKEKMFKTKIEKYGYRTSFNDPEHKKKLLQNLEDKYISDLKISNPNLIMVDKIGRNNFFKCDNGKDHVFEIGTNLLCYRKNMPYVICTICNDPKIKHKSLAQNEIYEFIKEYYPSTQVGYRYKSPSNLREIDLYIDSLKIGFEYNGMFYHSDRYMINSYHNDKLNDCKNIGVKIYNIWEYDWFDKKDIVKSIILDKLNCGKIIINDNECDIKSVDNNEAELFLNEHYIKGFNNKIDFSYGLYFKNKLLSIISFANRDYGFELMSLCTNLDYNVTDGYKTLFEYFNRCHIFSKLETTIDLSYEDGLLYQQLGFEKTDNFYIDYIWFLKGKIYPKYKLDDDNLLVEYDLYEKGGYKLFDCGHETYSYTKS